MDRKQHGNIAACGDPPDGAGDRRHAVAEIFPPMRGDQDDPPAGEPCGDPIETCGQFGIRGDLRTGPMQRVDDRVAGHVDRVRRDRLPAQRLGRRFGGREMQRGDGRDDPPVHLLRPGVVDIAGAQPGFDMRDRNLAIISGERAGHRGGGIALDDDHVGCLGVHHLAQPDQQARGKPVERLTRFHQVEVDVRGDVSDREDLIK